MVHPTECANKVICDRRIIPHALYLITEVARNKLSGISVPDAQHFASKNLTDLVGRKATRVILGNVPVAGEQAASATFGDVHGINLACGPPHGQGLVTFKTGAGAEHAETLFTFLGASDGQGQVLTAARSRSESSGSSEDETTVFTLLRLQGGPSESNINLVRLVLPQLEPVQPGAARIIEIVPASTFCDASFEAFWALLDEVGLEAIPPGPTAVHTVSSLPSAVAALVSHVRERRAARSTPLVEDGSACASGVCPACGAGFALAPAMTQCQVRAAEAAHPHASRAPRALSSSHPLALFFPSSSQRPSLTLPLRRASLPAGIVGRRRRRASRASGTLCPWHGNGAQRVALAASPLAAPPPPPRAGAGLSPAC